MGARFGSVQQMATAGKYLSRVLELPIEQHEEAERMAAVLCCLIVDDDYQLDVSAKTSCMGAPGNRSTARARVLSRR